MGARDSSRSVSGVRAYLRTPTALAWTSAGVVAVAAVVVAGWQLTITLASNPVVAGAVLGDLGSVVVFSVAVVAVLVAAVVVWIPCSAAIAYAVGRRVRGHSTTLLEPVDVVRSRAEPLFRWLKTHLAIGPIADRILTDDDVFPSEVAVGCDAFVVPAIVLDAPTLPSAVERANRTVPQSGRQRIQLFGIAATAALAIVVWAFGSIAGLATLFGPIVSSFGPSPAAVLVVAAVVVGIVATAAFDIAWRAGVYAGSDLDEGFARS